MDDDELWGQRKVRSGPGLAAGPTGPAERPQLCRVRSQTEQSGGKSFSPALPGLVRAEGANEPVGTRAAETLRSSWRPGALGRPAAVQARTAASSWSVLLLGPGCTEQSKPLPYSGNYQKPKTNGKKHPMKFHSKEHVGKFRPADATVCLPTPRTMPTHPPNLRPLTQVLPEPPHCCENTLWPEPSPNPAGCTAPGPATTHRPGCNPILCQAAEMAASISRCSKTCSRFLKRGTHRCSYRSAAGGC